MSVHPRSRRHGAALLALAAGLALILALLPHGGPADLARADQRPTFTNAVSDSFADTFADPAVIQGKDGWYYAYATADPLKEGAPYGYGHIARTKDWVNWEYLGEIFSPDNWPSWAAPTAGLWAPDIRYIGGQYVLYFTVTDTADIPGGWDPAIGAATAPTPAGPWTPTDKPVVAPRFNPAANNYFNTIDPAGFTDLDGKHYMYFGNYYGGTFVVELSADGLSEVGDETQVGISDRYEGTYVVEHDGWYYMMASSANCCAGPSTGYSVFVGRSKSPKGPFLDAQGLDLNASVTGGTLVVTQNGNRFIGAGHNAAITDLSGRDYLVYHAIPRDDAWLTDPFGINERPMLIDKIDWINGWPVVNGGPTDTPQQAPVTTSAWSGDRTDPRTAFTGLGRRTDPLGGQVGVLSGKATSKQLVPSGDLHLRMDVKSTDSLQLRLGRGPGQVLVTLSPSTLSVKAADAASSDAVGKARYWRTLVVEVKGGTVTAEVSESDLRDPAARAQITSKRAKVGGQRLELNGQALIDNVSVNTLAVSATALAPQPVVTGTPIFDDQFSGTAPDARWSWVRPDGVSGVADGSLNLPLASVDISGGANNGALLLTDAPADSDWIFETKMTLDLGERSIRNFQQAGVVVYNNDDDFARLGSVAIGETRTMEWGREHAAGEGLGPIYGAAIVGASAPTVWMRVAHHRNAAGEHLYRAAISHDGQNWIWGATWVLAADSQPQIGLYSGGGANPAAVATFDYATLHPASAAAGVWPN